MAEWHTRQFQKLLIRKGRVGSTPSISTMRVYWAGMPAGLIGPVAEYVVS